MTKRARIKRWTHDNMAELAIALNEDAKELSALAAALHTTCEKYGLESVSIDGSGKPDRAVHLLRVFAACVQSTLDRKAPRGHNPRKPPKPKPVERWQPWTTDRLQETASQLWELAAEVKGHAKTMLATVKKSGDQSWEVESSSKPERAGILLAQFIGKVNDALRRQDPVRNRLARYDG